MTIKRPTCSKCGSVMRLFGIEPEKPGFELHTFVCPKCQHVEIATAQIP
jgi:ribosomal protein S27AE